MVIGVYATVSSVAQSDLGNIIYEVSLLSRIGTDWRDCAGRMGQKGLTSSGIGGTTTGNGQRVEGNAQQARDSEGDAGAP